jgi:ubiquinone/menaquinone biosynthesis C-methylase UbiE
LNNIQTFSKNSDQYARHRPQYPEQLFSYLSEICVEHDSAWDCATGNGQAAVSLAKYFSHVEATDVSAEQIEHGLIHPRVHYSVSPAEHTLFYDQSFDLITVATAVHWFDQNQFFHEVDRVLKPNGVLAIWGYSFLYIDTHIDELITNELLKPVDRFWASGNHQVMNGYRDLALPFHEITDSPAFTMKIDWNMNQFLAYVKTWSAVKRYRIERGIDLVKSFEPKLKVVWGDPNQARVVKMPIFFRASRKSA